MTYGRRLIALLSALFLLPFLAVTTATSMASAADDDSGSLFQPLPGFKPSTSANASVRPSQFRAYRVDLAGVRAALAGGATLTIPDPADTPTDFQVTEDSVMAPALQAAHPEIRTYAGSAANGTSIRLDVTPFGFHAMVRRPDGVAWYVEPATRALGEDRVLSFAGSAAGDSGETFVEQEVRRTSHQVHPVADEDFSTPGGLVSKRTYRLALVTDPAYAAFVAPGMTTHATADVPVLAAKATLVNRVNEVYNDDAAYEFQMIPGTDTKLNLLNADEMSGANGPCGVRACFPGATGSYDCGNVLDDNVYALGQLVGADTFDIGHIGLGVNGGGIAGLGVVGTADKAVGCTGVPTPVGDVYAIDYVAHEMGHQMGGNHTFNGTQANCSGGNRNGATSVEPGSGVTIMAYAGICASDDLQPHSDPYFSFKSIDEFEATTAAAPGNEQEQQVVNLTAFDATDSFTLSCSACPTSGAITNGTTYNSAGLAAAVLAVTGQAATVTGPTGSGVPDANGFMVNWTGTSNIPTLTVTPVSGTFTYLFTGVIVNGGPDTNGGTVTVSADHSPTVTAPASKTIPKQTPFTLTGSAADADLGDVVTYQWEQTDNGIGAGTSLVSNTKLTGPLFRVFGTYADVSPAGTVMYHSPGENLAGTDPSRTFPDLAQILAGNTNAATGTCPAPAGGGTVPVSDPALNCFSEFLPTATWVGSGDRTMHFRLTARDEFTADPAADHAGGVSWANTALTVDNTAGPFLVTSRATAGSASGFENVTWDVNGTDTAALAQNVKISLSSDGGLTYPTVLAASTPNDGAETVVLPNASIPTARIKVEAVGNYFFDVNDATFSITPSGGNLAPIVNAGPDGTVAVGSPFSSSGSVTDDNLTGATATVNYGDGAGPQPLTLTGSTFNLSHTYATAGTKTVTVVVTDAGALSGSDTASVTVTAATPPPGPAASAVDATAKPKKITEGHKLKVKATVTTASGVPAGTVQVYLGTKLLGTGTLANGKVTIKLSKRKAKKLEVGKNTLTAKYLGSATVAASQVDFVVKVKKQQ